MNPRTFFGDFSLYGPGFLKIKDPLAGIFDSKELSYLD
jgi:hypothetical protein